MTDARTSEQSSTSRLPNGAGAAALFAAGLGALTLAVVSDSRGPFGSFQEADDLLHAYWTALRRHYRSDWRLAPELGQS